MMVAVRERERKLDLPHDLDLPGPAELVRAVRGCRTVELSEVVQHARYHDTDDRRLLRVGATLRHRDDEGWMVKLPSRAAAAGWLDREEVRFDGSPDELPGPAAELVWPLARGAALVEVARLRTRRRRARLMGDGGSLLAEVTLDDVVATAPDGAELARFAEAEIELGEVAPAALDRLVELLRARGAGDPVDAPKLVRALGDPGPPDVVVPELSADATVRQAITAAIARSVAQLQRELPWVLLDAGPEPVHQARVATRRLRSDLRTFRPLLDAEWAAARRDELRRLADALGVVRDADVLGLRLHDHADGLDERHRADLDEVLARLDADRAAAWTALRPAVLDPATAELLDHLVEAARSPHVAPEAADRPAVEVLPALVARPWRHLERAVGRLGDDPPDEALHDVRIRAKRCRYAAEAIDPALGGAARKFAEAAATLQDRLGEWHDAVVAAEWLDGVAADVAPRVAFAAGLLARGESDDAARLRERWRPAYDRLAAPKRRRWMPDG